MKSALPQEISELTEAIQYRPAISIILPFEPKMSAKTEIAQSLKSALDKVKRELAADYPPETEELMMQKLKRIVDELNFNTHKKSIAIYASPVFEKVLYLDVAVEERVMIDKSFEIRDLVYSKKQLHKYLLLILGGSRSQMYLGNTTTFNKIISDSSHSIYAYVNDAPQRVGNFSNPSDRKEAIMEKYLHHIDNSLGHILNAYPLPLFVMGTKRIMGHFKNLSRHSSQVINYIHGNFEEASAEELQAALQPYVADWQKVIQDELLMKLNDAMGSRKLATGMREVWQSAMQRNGRLLVVEKNFMYPAEKGSGEDTIRKSSGSYNKFSFIKDAVDDVIEHVLSNGGDVEFVDPGLLNEYQHIALIKFY